MSQTPHELTTGTQRRLVKILAPRNNQRDALACETLLATLAASCEHPIALEIAGTPDERMFLVRGQPDAVALVLSQLASAYPQCDFADVPLQADPVQTSAPARRAIELRLREPAHLPLRTAATREGRSTYDDFARAADPMLGLFSAMADVREGEACLIQFSLAPMPDNWSKFWRGALNDVNERAKLMPQHAFALALSQAALLMGMLGSSTLALAATFRLGASVWIMGLALVLLALVCLVWRFRLPSPPDPLLVQQKINQSAFRVWARVFVWAADDAAAARHMARMQAALKGYNLAGANGFISKPSKDTDAQHIAFLPEAGWAKWPLIGRLHVSWRLPILSVSELAGLWHLPHAEAGLQGIAYTASKQLAPLPQQVAQGVWIGHSRAQCRSTTVRLSAQQLRGNIGLVAKTQSGKSNLMALLINDIIANDPDASVIVIDPHRRLAQQVAACIPPSREPKTIYWNLADSQRPFGLNLIDRAPFTNSNSNSNASTVSGASALFLSDATPVPVDTRVSNVIDAFNEIWPQNWGPRMEDYLRGPLLTMANANDALLAEFAFHQWRLGAQTAFAENSMNTALDDVLSIADTHVPQLVRLRPPPSETAQLLYRKLGPHVKSFLQNRGSPHAAALLAPTFSAMAHLLCVDNPALREMQPGPGLLARIYKRDDVMHPLQYTLLDVNPMLANPDLRDEALGALDPNRHQHLWAWWRDSFDAYWNGNPRLLMDMVTPVRTKLNRFVASDVARRIFGQPQSTIDLPNLIRDGGVLIVDLAAGVIGQENAALIGSAVLNWLAALIFARDDNAAPKPRRILLVVDEFQSIPGADYAFMLSELAKYGVQLCLGTQSLGVLDKLNEKTRHAWLSNTSALFVFRSGADDAEMLAHELSVGDADRLTVTASDIVGLPDYACFVRVKDIAMPFRVETRKADEGDADTFARIAEASRQKHGRAAAEVDAWLHLAAECQGEPQPKPRRRNGPTGGPPIVKLMSGGVVE
jgi:hypothetical protein